MFNFVWNCHTVFWNGCTHTPSAEYKSSSCLTSSSIQKLAVSFVKTWHCANQSRATSLQPLLWTMPLWRKFHNIKITNAHVLCPNKPSSGIDHADIFEKNTELWIYEGLHCYLAVINNRKLETNVQIKDWLIAFCTDNRILYGFKNRKLSMYCYGKILY